MTAFLLLLWKNPLVRKALVYAAVSLAVLYAFKLWLNKHDDRVYRQGKIAASAEIQKQKEAEWKAREAELETRARRLEEARARIEIDRLNLHRSLDNALNSLSAVKDRDFTAAAAVPADRLDDALRALTSPGTCPRMTLCLGQEEATAGDGSGLYRKRQSQANVFGHLPEQ